MKKIAVLIDFTEGSKAALRQAAALTQKIHGTLYGIHIVHALHKSEEVEKELAEFMMAHVPADVPIHAMVSEGNLIPATQETLRKIAADLVVVCTHGIKGMFQHLFGAQILKLVQGLSYPCIVIQEHCKVDLIAVKKILFPVGPHPDFSIKIRQTALFARVMNATVFIYEINRPGSDFENLVTINVDAAIQYFEEHAIPYQRVMEEIEVISVGYSRQTLEYAAQNKMDMLSLMATVSKNDTLFGFGDKENFLVNEQGISVLACNL